MSLTDREKNIFKKSGIKGMMAQDVTPSDSSTLTLNGAKLYVGTGGDVKIDTSDGDTITLKNVASGTFIDFVSVKKVHSRGTTARNIVSIY
tara:strand:+ start:464 stop:736 length:273 start_codon:yes stop_codon:yes gene_type:complete